ncbi:MAG: DUF192 domain-containing protein [Sphingobium sp.]
MIRPPIFLIALALAACSARSPQAQDSAANAAAPTASARLPLLVRSEKGQHRFAVEVAATPEQQEKGLMFRKTLDDDGGMLFPMNPPRTASFWMKNTVILLDMIFVRTDGTIAFIGANTQPYSRDPVSAGVPVAAVLELRGGRAGELGIVPGDQIVWGSCAAPNAQPTPIAPDFCPPPVR